MNLRVAIEQTNPRLGDVHANLQDHMTRIDRACGEGAQLVVFPELSLTGYFLKDQVFELGMGFDHPVLMEIAARSKDVSIAVGFVERTREERFYNTLAFFEDGKLIGAHRKVHLVSYGMFDEARDFAAGQEFRTIESKLGRFGPMICEDFWHMTGGYLYFLDNVDALLVASASPARGVAPGGDGLEPQRSWAPLLRASALMYRTWVLYAGRVGWEDGVGFGGCSTVYEPGGALRESLPGIEEGTLSVKLEAAALRRARVETPLRRDEKPWILRRGLERHRIADHGPLGPRDEQ